MKNILMFILLWIASLCIGILIAGISLTIIENSSNISNIVDEQVDIISQYLKDKREELVKTPKGRILIFLFYCVSLLFAPVLLIYSLFHIIGIMIFLLIMWFINGE